MVIAAITIKMSTAASRRPPPGCSLIQVSYSAAALRSSTGSARDTSRQKVGSRMLALRANSSLA